MANCYIQCKCGRYCDERPCYKCLKKENKNLKERIAFAVDYLPECPDKAKSFLVPKEK